VSPVKYEQGFYIPEDNILHSPLRENLKSYKSHGVWFLFFFISMEMLLFYQKAFFRVSTVVYRINPHSEDFVSRSKFC
jgi:hypothetical protein